MMNAMQFTLNTLMNLSPSSVKTRKPLKRKIVNVDGNNSISHKKIISFLRKTGGATNVQIAADLGLSLARTKVLISEIRGMLELDMQSSVHARGIYRVKK